MKTIDVLKLMDFIPGMPWGISCHQGHALRQVAIESRHFIKETQKTLKDDANYIVIWDSLKLRDFINKLPNADIIIEGGCTKKYLWELEN